MFKKDKDYLSLTLDSENFRIVHFRISPTEKQLIDVSKCSVRDIAPEDVHKTIQRIVKEFSSLQTKDFGCRNRPTLGH